MAERMAARPDYWEGPGSSETLRAMSKVAAAICLFSHQPSGSEAATPCTACWLAPVTRYHSYFLT